MNLTTIRPGPDLERHVHSFFHYTDYAPSHSVERVLPDGSPYLVIALDGLPRRVFDNADQRPVQRLETAWLSGVRKDYITIEALRDSSMVAIRFRPGGARAVLGPLLEQSVGRVVPLPELTRLGVEKLHRDLVAADDARAAWQLMESWLLGLLDPRENPPPPISKAIEEIQKDPLFAVTNLSQLVATSGYSQKQFIFHFKKHVGLTPKTFQRIVRFNEIVPQVQAEHALSWAEISLQCGYYDQSHFIREFKAFSGYKPIAFLEGSGDRSNFIPVDRT